MVTSSGVAFADDVQRLAALADYVAADYPGAVKDGRVVNPDEYKEQRALVAQARELAARLPNPAPLLADLDRIAAALEARASEETVAAHCRALHKRLLDEHGLVLAPLAPPNEARARELYDKNCASCHGADGRAQTEKARELKPPPVSFFDGERMSRVSPALAFHALTFGIPDTGMAAFDTLPASDRWSLAFYVVAMRHREAPKPDSATLKAASEIVAPTASRLADLSDAQLAERLRGHEGAIPYFRSTSSFAAAPGGRFAEARRMLSGVAAAAGERARARDLAIAAYLEGVEPHEAILRARDPKTADAIERAFGELRRAIDEGGSADEISRQVARITKILDAADELAAGGAGVPFFAALAIALREGFELSLLVAALLAFVRKSGHGEHARWIHLGWLAAIPAGVATWFLVGAALAGAQRELTEGILTLFAAAMLLFVSNFVLGRLESRKWLKFLERKTVAAAKSTVHWPLMTMAFVAAYREAIEIVLFFRALWLGAPEHGSAILGGAAVGALALGLLVVVMAQLGKRLNPRPVMTASSVILTALAISLVGQGIHALQEGGFVGVRAVGEWSLPTLGLYATLQGLATQAVVLILVLVPWWLEKRNKLAA